MRELSTTERASFERYWYGERVDETLLRLGDIRTWQCDLGHLWNTPVHRILAGRGCHVCTNRIVLAGFNDLATTHPHLLDMWDYERNHRLPSEVLAGTREAAAWRCQQGHQWEAAIYSRMQGLGCPFCSGKQVLAGYNDLATVNPALATEWSPKNTIKPTEVTEYSHQKVLWQCLYDHEWTTSVKHRSVGTGCPQCFRNGITSTLEHMIREHVTQIVHDVSPTLYDILANDRTALRGKELDMYIPALRLGLEVNGNYWHHDTHIMPKLGISAATYHQQKIDAATSAGIMVGFIWEQDWHTQQGTVLEAVHSLVQACVRARAVADAQGEQGSSGQVAPNVILPDILNKVEHDLAL